MFERRKRTPTAEDIKNARNLFIKAGNAHGGSVVHQALEVALALYDRPNIHFFGLAEALRDSPDNVEIIRQATERTHAKVRAEMEANLGRTLACDEGPPAEVSPGVVKTTVTHVFTTAGHLVHMRKSILNKELDTPRGTMTEQGEKKKRLSKRAINYPVRYRRPRSLFRRI
jgi:hypothetical protein